MELKDTVEMMLSDDYKERFKAEYQQVKIRRNKLGKMLDDWDAGKLNFNPTCPKAVLRQQYMIMDQYLHILEYRAFYEGVELEVIVAAEKLFESYKRTKAYREKMAEAAEKLKKQQALADRYKDAKFNGEAY